MWTDESRFLALLEKHLERSATPEEAAHLLQMIKSGLYDKLLKQKIDHALVERPVDRDITVEAAHRVLYNILSSEERTARLIPPARPLIPLRIWVPAAAILLLLTGWWLWPSSTPNPLARTELKASTPSDTGKGKYVRLPDGSTVLLNGNSKLEYGAGFNKDKREVTLTGEGYFDIHNDDKKPFIVHARGVSTTVLGTAFNIRAWPGQLDVVVTVTRGKVKVSDKARSYGILLSNQQLAVNTETNDFSNTRVDARTVTAWKNDYLVLDDISMAGAARLIEDKYHVHVVLASDKLKDCHVAATFLAHESLEQVLKVVSAIVGGAYTIQPNDQVIISGNCN
jgi:ferric-dicitrate binding protein FerR (iron transport regulator)